MKNTHHAKMTELLIGKDLSWLKAATQGREARARKAQDIGVPPVSPSTALFSAL
jgi:hypothetical protein